MKKELINRILLGMPLGIALGYVITVIISVCINDGNFYPVVPEFINVTKNELNAVVLQTILCALMGSIYATASIIWQIDSWSLVKQSGIYFATICIATLPIAYITNWMKHTFIGIFSYILIFILIFCIVWLIQYFVWKNKIKKMNEKIVK